MNAPATLDDGTPIAFRAHPGPQTKFLASTCREILYGGQAGGGKSAAITVMPLRWVHLSNLYTITFRRAYPDLYQLLKEARRFYPAADSSARYVGNPFPHYRFGSGAVVRYGHMNHADDWGIYTGQEIHVLCFDELTTFTKAQYQNLVSRVRGIDPTYPRRIRSTSNPGGEGHQWVFERWEPWLNPMIDMARVPMLKERFDEKGVRLPPAASGQVLWVLSKRDGTEEFVPEGTPNAFSRTFISARLEDNPTLMLGDPEYQARLLDNDPVRIRQLRDGDWLASYGARLMFKREHFRLLDEVPWYPLQVRAWDMAATAEKVDAQSTDARRAGGKGTPDWTVGTRYGTKGDGRFCVMDVQRKQLDPAGVWNLILSTAKTDGRGVAVVIEQEGGSSGKFSVEAIRSALGSMGFAVIPSPATGSKIVRARAVSATAAPTPGDDYGRVDVVRAPWNIPWLNELEQFPDSPHDDQVDSVSHAHNVITTLPVPTGQVRLLLPPQ